MDKTYIAQWHTNALRRPQQLASQGIEKCKSWNDGCAWAHNIMRLILDTLGAGSATHFMKRKPANREHFRKKTDLNEKNKWKRLQVYGTGPKENRFLYLLYNIWVKKDSWHVRNESKCLDRQYDIWKHIRRPASKYPNGGIWKTFQGHRYTSLILIREEIQQPLFSSKKQSSPFRKPFHTVP